VARDATARQYDVDKNSVKLYCEPGPGDYRPGTITFNAKKGKSIDLDKMRESIAATRLSGGTNMRVDYLEITATGAVTAGNKDVVLAVSGTGQEFMLGEDPEAKKAEATPLARLREALRRGDTVVSVSGRVQGWNGKFPAVLRALAAEKARSDTTGNPSRTLLLVTDFEVRK